MLFCIGDVHGHFDKLMALIRHCEDYSEVQGGGRADFILLGDYIDRGPDSEKVIAFLMANQGRFRGILGNHEDLLLEALDGGHALDRWLENGGNETLQSYRHGRAGGIPHGDIDFIRALPLFIDDGLRLFVHAGIDPAHPDQRNRDVLLWTRKHPPPDASLPRFVVHGHTPVRTAGPELHANRLNLDTGAGWGRRLSAAAFNPEDVRPKAFLNDLGEVIHAPKPESR